MKTEISPRGVRNEADGVEKLKGCRGNRAGEGNEGRERIEWTINRNDFSRAPAIRPFLSSPRTSLGVCSPCPVPSVFRRARERTKIDVSGTSSLFLFAEARSAPPPPRPPFITRAALELIVLQFPLSLWLSFVTPVGVEARKKNCLRTRGMRKTDDRSFARARYGRKAGREPKREG